MYQKIFLKPNKELPILKKHHWIFSGAVSQIPSKIQTGDIVQVYTSNSRLLGHGFFHSNNTIQIRMINFDHTDPLISIEKLIHSAFEKRVKFFDENITNCYRVVNSEGDELSGLTVDRYSHYLVIQISSAGIEKMKEKVVESLLAAAKILGVHIDFVYERSNNQGRTAEGLNESVKILFGNTTNPSQIVVLENGIKFKVDVVNGQKTGLFLDMREMRELISKLSTKKRLLNCFGYNGGFSLYAARNQAKTTTIDISKPAILGARENFEINKFDLNEHTFIDTDVFTYISENSLENFDIIILDPPAFAKKKSDINNAIRAYKKLNRITFSKAQKGALVLTCSCSFHIDEQTFLSIVREALLESNKSGKIISKHRLAYDHPINIFHTENNYLKSLLIALD